MMTKYVCHGLTNSLAKLLQAVTRKVLQTFQLSISKDMALKLFKLPEHFIVGSLLIEPNLRN